MVSKLSERSAFLVYNPADKMGTHSPAMIVFRHHAWQHYSTNLNSKQLKSSVAQLYAIFSLAYMQTMIHRKLFPLCILLAICFGLGSAGGFLCLVDLFVCGRAFLCMCVLFGVFWWFFGLVFFFCQFWVVFFLNELFLRPQVCSVHQCSLGTVRCFRPPEEFLSV